MYDRLKSIFKSKLVLERGKLFGYMLCFLLVRVIKHVSLVLTFFVSNGNDMMIFMLLPNSVYIYARRRKIYITDNEIM